MAEQIVQIVQIGERLAGALLSVMASSEVPSGEVDSRLDALLATAPEQGQRLRLGPTEWMLVVPVGASSDRAAVSSSTEGLTAAETGWAERLRTRLAGLTVDVQIVTDAWSVWALTGPSSELARFIASGTAVDPWSERSRTRGGVRCLLGPFTVLLRAQGAEELEVWVERSYSDALGVWMRRLALGRTAGCSGGGMVSRGAVSGT